MRRPVRFQLIENFIQENSISRSVTHNASSHSSDEYHLDLCDALSSEGNSTSDQEGTYVRSSNVGTPSTMITELSTSQRNVRSKNKRAASVEWKTIYKEETEAKWPVVRVNARYISRRSRCEDKRLFKVSPKT